MRLLLAMRPLSTSTRVSSNSAMPMPYTIPPSSWLRAVLAFRTRPVSNAATSRESRISPVSSSMRISANCAPKACMEYCCFSAPGRRLSNCVQRRHVAMRQQLGDVDARAGAGHDAVPEAEQRPIDAAEPRSRIGKRQREHLLPRRAGRRLHRRRDTRDRLRSARDGRLRQAAVTELEAHAGRRQTKFLRRNLRHHRVGPGAQILRARHRERGAIGEQADPRRRPAAGWWDRSRSPCPFPSRKRPSRMERGCGVRRGHPNASAPRA